MKRVPHGRKSKQARRSLGRANRVWGLVVPMALAPLLAACNIVQGFQDAGDSLFPEQSTHLASPGLRVVSGNYRDLGVVGGTELYLLARGADDDTGKLFSMRYADPRPCEIPAVVRFSATRESSRSAPILSYFEEDVRQGKLRFVDASCKILPLSFEDARLPVAETKTSLVVWAGTDLWLATPEAGSKELLADEVSSVTSGVVGSRHVVRANGRLTVFDADWKVQGTFGEDAGSLLRAGKSLFYLDAVGAHRIVASKHDSSLVESTLLARDACSLGTQDGKWVTLRSPCSGGKVIAIHEPTGDSFTLPFDAEPSQLRLVPAADSDGRDPLQDPFWFFYLRSGEAEGSENTLHVRTPAGEEHALGAHATLDHLRLVESEAEPYGYALVDVEGETGRYVWWNAAGETRVLAESAVRRTDRLIIDYDGVVGSLAVADGERLRVLAKGVPWQAFEYQDHTKQWTVLFHDMQEGMGRLAVIPAGLDQLESRSAHEALTLPALSEVASDVVVLGTSPMNELLSGVLYLTGFDVTTRTGRLEYRNLELRFTADVNDGVSDYLITNDEVLYAIPYGDDAGIWLVSGK
jgi:hypothetical protein